MTLLIFFVDIFEYKVCVLGIREVIVEVDAVPSPSLPILSTYTPPTHSMRTLPNHFFHDIRKQRAG
jgi:hypothetical protein